MAYRKLTSRTIRYIQEDNVKKLEQTPPIALNNHTLQITFADMRRHYSAEQIARDLEELGFDHLISYAYLDYKDL